MRRTGRSKNGEPTPSELDSRRRLDRRARGRRSFAADRRRATARSLSLRHTEKNMTLPPVVFADAGYYIARLSRQDAEHRRAVAWAQIHRHTSHYTNRYNRGRTVGVVELLCRQGGRAGRIRRAIERLHAHSRVSIVPFDADLVSEAVEMYGKRPDQGMGCNGLLIVCCNATSWSDRGTDVRSSFRPGGLYGSVASRPAQ